MNLKKTVAVAAAALALVGGASFSVATAHADDTKELLLKTNDPRVQAVQVYDDSTGTWSACIPTPDPNVYTSTQLQVRAETLAVDAFSRADCYPGELKDGMLVGGSTISNGWIDAAPGFKDNTTGQAQVDLYPIR